MSHSQISELRRDIRADNKDWRVTSLQVVMKFIGKDKSNKSENAQDWKQKGSVDLIKVIQKTFSESTMYSR